MAARLTTFTFEQALAVAGRKISRSTVDDFGATAANFAQNYIWDKYDWRWSLATLPPFYVVPNEQDHGAPAVVIPPDFYGLRTAYLIRSDNTPPFRMPLKIIKDLEETHIRYLPHAIWYQPDKRAFRIMPRLPDNIGSPMYFVNGTYKKLPVNLTAATLNTTLLPSDDIYSQAWVETLKWALLSMDGDQRAGTISEAGGNLVANGQAAMMISMIKWMAEKEGLELGDPAIAPAEPLVVSGSWRPFLYGVGVGGW